MSEDDQTPDARGPGGPEEIKIPGVADPAKPTKTELMFLERAVSKGWLGDAQKAEGIFDGVTNWAVSQLADDGAKDSEGNVTRKGPGTRTKIRLANLLRLMAADRVKAIEVQHQIEKGDDLGGQATQLQLLIIQTINQVGQTDPTLAANLQRQLEATNPSLSSGAGPGTIRFRFGDNTGNKKELT